MIPFSTKVKEKKKESIQK